jgi:hypothetical protein
MALETRAHVTRSILRSSDRNTDPVLSSLYTPALLLNRF